MTPEQMAKCFNEWMREYTEEPETFNREWQAVQQFLTEENAGQEPSYGADCAALMQHYAQKLGIEG